mgnify:CR=1 FL=1
MAESQWISVTASVEEVQKALAGTSKSLNSIQRQTIAVIARGTVKAIKQGIKESVGKRTGELLKCYGYRIRRDGSRGSVYPRGSSGASIFPKAFIQNYGHEGPTARASSWKILPKAFIQKGEKYASGSDYMRELQSLVDKNLKKYWG